MVDDAFERAARGVDRLAAGERRRAALRMTGASLAGTVIGLAVATALFDVTTTILLTVATPTLLVIGGAGLLAALGVITPSPLWSVPFRDQWHVGNAVTLGRPVRDPALAGLAVTAAQWVRKNRWVVWLVAVAVPLNIVGLAISRDRDTALLTTTLPMLLVGAMTLLSQANAPKAEAANQALLDRS